MPEKHGATKIVPVSPTKRSASPARQAALDWAKKYLTGKKTPVKTAEIFAYLNLMGIEIGGNDPQNNLSAMLSNSPEFHSMGRIGWILVGDPTDLASATNNSADASVDGTASADDREPEQQGREAGPGGGI